MFNDLKQCYGCSACYCVCDLNAISMRRDNEGFWIPDVNERKCVECGKCEAICPVHNTSFRYKNPLAGYAFIGNEKLRDTSSSGGAFGTIATGILSEGGCVCGASFVDEYKHVGHIIIDDKSDLFKIQKSKYVQSRMGDIYKAIKDLLCNDKKVFFCGTPCQVAGLNSYLDNEYDNLVTADLICHAANSEYAWEKYLDEKGNVSFADFRDKEKYYPFSMKLCIGEEIIYETQSECDYMQAFFGGLITRSSCDACPFPYYGRVGDITLADFWGVETLLTDLNVEKGCSAILVNSEKGEDIVEQYLEPNANVFIPVAPEDIITRNGAAEHCFHSHPGKKGFFERLNRGETFSSAYMNSKKTKFDYGLIGFWYTPNYGAALTAYALSKTIKDMGFSILMLDAPRTIFPDDNFVYDHDSPVRRFISQYCHISDRYQSYGELQTLNDLCKGFILGSDQLWGWYEGKYHDSGAYYLLDFVQSDKKKIAYGTSFGKEDFTGNSEDQESFGFFLKRFSAVSVREKDAVNLCTETFGVDSSWVVDPVFLLSEDDYRNLAIRSIIDNKERGYIFVYLLQPTTEKNRIIRELSEAMGKRIIAVSDLYPDYNMAYPCSEWEFDYLTKIEVADWVRLLSESDFVITDSYHGFCFSIIFRKQFIALTPRDGLNRFQSVAEITDLLTRIDIGGSNNFQHMELSDIDYESVWDKLQPEVDRSREWLSNALAKEYTPKDTDPIYDITRFDLLRFRDNILSVLQEELQTIKSQYGAIFSMSCKLRRQSYITRRYIVRDYLMRRLENKRVAIRGAGGHTSEILSILVDTDVIVVCVWDKNTNSDVFEGHSIVRNASELKTRDVDSILISSWKYRNEMKADVERELDEAGINGLDILDFYEELQERGIPIDSEYFWYDWDEL